jgi:outer membrane biosynthesis protein TonB
MFVKLIFLSGFLFVLFVGVHAQRTIDGVRVGIINGSAKYLPIPKYPQEAKDSCVGGKVEVLAELMASGGKPLTVKAISGDELLRNSAEEAVRKAIFHPRQELVRDYKVKGIIVYNFDPFVKCIVGGIVNKKALSLPQPQVPNLNKPKHLQIKEEQIVAVQIVVDEGGKVISAKAISGHPFLRTACQISARLAKFAPSMIDGPSVRVKVLLVYKFKPDGTIDTDIESDDKTVIGTPINLVEPPPPFCNCRGLGGSVLVQAKIDEQGNVIEAKTFSGHPVLRFPCEKAALESKFLPTNTKSKIVISYNFESSDGGRTAKLKNIEIKEVKF